VLVQRSQRISFYEANLLWDTKPRQLLSWEWQAQVRVPQLFPGVKSQVWDCGLRHCLHCFREVCVSVCVRVCVCVCYKQNNAASSHCSCSLETKHNYADRISSIYFQLYLPPLGVTFRALKASRSSCTQIPHWTPGLCRVLVRPLFPVRCVEKIQNTDFSWIDVTRLLSACSHIDLLSCCLMRVMLPNVTQVGRRSSVNRSCSSVSLEHRDGKLDSDTTSLFPQPTVTHPKKMHNSWCHVFSLLYFFRSTHWQLQRIIWRMHLYVTRLLPPSSLPFSVPACRLERGCPTRERPWAPPAHRTAGARRCGPACPPPRWSPAARGPPPPSRASSSSRGPRAGPESESVDLWRRPWTPPPPHGLFEELLVCLLRVEWLRSRGGCGRFGLHESGLDLQKTNVEMVTSHESWPAGHRPTTSFSMNKKSEPQLNAGMNIRVSDSWWILLIFWSNDSRLCQNLLLDFMSFRLLVLRRH